MLLSRRTLLTIPILACLLLAEPAFALRCGTKLVRDGMHEAQVLAICGEPATRRTIGRTLRDLELHPGVRPGGVLIGRRVYPGLFPTEILITEYVYNFGPRKLMRRLVFEGSVLVSIESLGHGYLEKPRRE